MSSSSSATRSPSATSPPIARTRSATPIDFDALPAQDVDVPAIYSNHQFSNELQLLYESEQAATASPASIISNAKARNIFDVVLATTGALIGVPGFTASTFGEVHTKTWAAFADFTYDFTDQFQLSLGGRYTSDNRRATVIRKNLIGGAVARARRRRRPARRAHLQLHRREDLQGIHAARLDQLPARTTTTPSMRAGRRASRAAASIRAASPPRRPTSTATESARPTRSSITSCSIRRRSPATRSATRRRLFDRRLRLALAGFYADYKDVQVPGSVGAVINGIPTFVGVTTNAGKASFKGVEVEALATLFRGDDGSRLTFAGTLGYLDAQYDEFITNVARASARARSTSPTSAGSRTRRNGPCRERSIIRPRWPAARSTSTRRSPTGSKTFQFETPSPFLDQPGYALWDANLVWTSRNDRCTIGLHAKNILDKQYITSGYQFLSVNPVTGVPIVNAGTGNVIPSLGREGVVTTFYGNPRQVFLSLGVKF